MVLTSGELAGVNLLAWFVFIWRGKVFHRMEREFRLEVICTDGKWQSALRLLLRPNCDHFQEHIGFAD
jgi:hypothetical protein